MSAPSVSNPSSSATTLLDLPNELLLLISEKLSTDADITRLQRTCSRFAGVLKDVALKDNIKRRKSSALLWAVKRRRVALVSHALALGADMYIEHVRRVWRGGRNAQVREHALSVAVKRGDPTLVAMLCEAFATFAHARDKMPTVVLRNLLGVALQQKRLDIGRILVDCLARFKKDYIFHLALCDAANVHALPTMRHLLQVGANPNFRPSPHYDVARDEHNGSAFVFLLETPLSPLSLEVLHLIFQCGIVLCGDFRDLGSNHRDGRVRGLFVARIRAETGEERSEVPEVMF